MEKYDYFRGVPEVGIVPRAPHAGPLLRHLYEQEHGADFFGGNDQRARELKARYDPDNVFDRNHNVAPAS